MRLIRREILAPKEIADNSAALAACRGLKSGGALAITGEASTPMVMRWTDGSEPGSGTPEDVAERRAWAQSYDRVRGLGTDLTQYADEMQIGVDALLRTAGVNPETFELLPGYPQQS